MNTISVDFGTSTTLAASRERRELPDVLRLGRSRSSFPSVARRSGEVFIAGEDALEAIPLSELIRWSKNAITRNVYNLDELGFPVTGSVDQAIIAILSEASTRIRSELGVTGNVRANLACPSGWRWDQRERLIGHISAGGFETRGDLVLIDEPVAAGAGWAEWRRSRGDLPEHARALVVDLGGGTLDVALVEVNVEEKLQFRVLSSRGIDWGGFRVDRLIAERLCEKGGRNDLLQEIDGSAIQSESAALVLREAENAKLALSRVDSYPVDLTLPEATLSTSLSRNELDDLTGSYVSEIERFAHGVARQGLLALGRRTTEVTKLGWDAMGITDVLLVGGGSRLHGISALFRHRLPNARLSSEIDYVAAEEMVVRGLTMPEEYFAMSLDRPHFSVRLIMMGQTTSIYDAYDPLYDGSLAIANDRPATRVQIQVPPSAVHVRLMFESATGEELIPRNNVDLQWGLKPSTTAIFSTFYADGTLILRSSNQNIVHLQIPNWDPLRKDFEVLVNPPAGPMGHFANPFEEGAPG